MASAVAGPCGAWSVNPPVNPTDITNNTGVGLLVIGAPGNFADYSCTGTYDSAVLLGPECAGTTFTRFHLLNAASVGTGPGFGRHALYCKAANVTCQDWYVRGDYTAPDIGSAFSVRYHGFSVTNFDVDFLYVASLFDDDPAHVAGTASFVNGTAVFHATTAILVATQIQFAVTLRNINFTGPTNAIMHIDVGSLNPTVTSQCVTINGAPAALANFENLPAGNLTIL